MNNKQLLGSQTAKDGFRNEADIVNKFNDWKKDKDAQTWLMNHINKKLFANYRE